MLNNQSLRWHLDEFTQGRITGKIEEGWSMTSIAADFGIAHSIISWLWRAFQIIETAVWRFISDPPKTTTATNILDTNTCWPIYFFRGKKEQAVGKIARHIEQAIGWLISHFIVAKTQVHCSGLFARWPIWCVPLIPAHWRRHFLCCWEHQNWPDNQWSSVLFMDVSRFNLSSSLGRIHIERAGNTQETFQYHNITEREWVGSCRVLVWEGTMLATCIDHQIFEGVQLWSLLL